MKEKKPGKVKTTVMIPSVFWNAGLPSSTVHKKRFMPFSEVD